MFLLRQTRSQKEDCHIRQKDQAKGHFLKNMGGNKIPSEPPKAAAAKGQGGKNKKRFNKDKYKNKNHTVNNVTGGDATKEPEIIECWVCHQRGDHHSSACLNGDVTVTIKNVKFQAVWEEVRSE